MDWNLDWIWDKNSLNDNHFQLQTCWRIKFGRLHTMWAELDNEDYDNAILAKNNYLWNDQL